MIFRQELASSHVEDVARRERLVWVLWTCADDLWRELVSSQVHMWRCAYDL